MIYLTMLFTVSFLLSRISLNMNSEKKCIRCMFSVQTKLKRHFFYLIIYHIPHLKTLYLLTRVSLHSKFCCHLYFPLAISHFFLSQNSRIAHVLASPNNRLYMYTNNTADIIFCVCLAPTNITQTCTTFQVYL